jgi:hypothetical protein
LATLISKKVICGLQEIKKDDDEDDININSDPPSLTQLSSKNINTQLLRRNSNGGSNRNIFSRRAHP